MQYNPAGLALSPGVSASFFTDPWKIISGSFGSSFPLSSYVVGARLPGIGSVGVEYTNRDWGDFVTTTPSSPDSASVFHTYERTVALGFAREVSDQLSLGAELRYAFAAFGPVDGRSTNLFAGAGLLYTPKMFARRLDIGFSLTDFGAPVKYTGSSGSDAAPSKLNLGVSGLPVTTDYFDINIFLGASKIFHKRSRPTHTARNHPLSHYIIQRLG